MTPDPLSDLDELLDQLTSPMVVVFHSEGSCDTYHTPEIRLAPETALSLS
jgi:hypothetical protein